MSTDLCNTDTTLLLEFCSGHDPAGMIFKFRFSMRHDQTVLQTLRICQRFVVSVIRDHVVHHCNKLKLMSIETCYRVS